MFRRRRKAFFLISPKFRLKSISSEGPNQKEIRV
jgi:hypothetical protein